MSDNPGGKSLEKYLGRNALGGGEAPLSADSDGTEDSGASFGWLRGIKDRAISLELRKRTGTILAVGYAFLEKIEFDASAGITLHFGRQQVIIKGRNLNGEIRPTVRLFEGIARHRVSWVAESNRAADLLADKNALVVETITW